LPSRGTLARTMEFSRNQVAIAVSGSVLIVLIFFGVLVWLTNQGPVLARSEERDSLSGIPNSITMNPLRDRASEQAAAKFIRAMRDGQRQQELTKWEKDYRKKYAAFICDTELRHPLLVWERVDWKHPAPPRTLHTRPPHRTR